MDLFERNEALRVLTERLVLKCHTKCWLRKLTLSVVYWCHERNVSWRVSIKNVYRRKLSQKALHCKLVVFHISSLLASEFLTGTSKKEGNLLEISQNLYVRRHLKFTLVIKATRVYNYKKLSLCILVEHTQKWKIAITPSVESSLFRI